MNKRICKICNKEFDFWHSKAKTCGKECSNKYSKIVKNIYAKNNIEKIRVSQKEHYHKHKKFKKKKCKICGKYFILRGAKARTCSEECRKENIRRNANKNSKIWVKKNPEKRKETSRIYSSKNKEQIKIKNKEWREENRDKEIEAVRRWRKKNPKKRNAQALAQSNIKIPPEELCKICNKENATHRHHEDYNHPLEVIFVCSKCHANLHLDKKT